MTLLAPGYLYAAMAAAAAVVVLHLIVTRRPRAAILPTARFVPDVPAAARSRALRPYDLLLLLLRVLLLLALGTALARPILTPPRERIARVIVADVSGSVARRSEVADSVRRLYRMGDVTVAFDSAAHATAASDSLPSIGVSAATGSLSAALIGALRAAPSVREGADSLELVLVSALLPAESDLATARIRALWPGRSRLVRVAPDTVVARGPPRIYWGNASRPAMTINMQRPDTSGAVVARGEVVVAPFVRRWSFPEDSLRGAVVIARWVDGVPAAVERVVGHGCVRSIAIPVDSAGDLVLRPEFIRLRELLSGPCGSHDVAGSAAGSAAGSVEASSGASVIASLAGSGKLAAAGMFPAATDVQSPLAPWLLGAALALAVIELLVRRRRVAVEQ
ncbi:MAG: BatA domain-containing protein [Gemmatimonadaceae bacterium]